MITQMPLTGTRPGTDVGWQKAAAAWSFCLFIMSRYMYEPTRTEILFI